MLNSEFKLANKLINSLSKSLNSIIIGKQQPIEWLLASFISGGHVLLEDVPGTGKTTLSKSLALSCHGAFNRIQFTPDLLPSDILGVSIFNPENNSFTFEEGPVFCNILLADEINRASPRTQSALLEAMAENQVSIEKEVIPLNPPFFVIATQNPIDFHGTYNLPEAQLDRFSMQFSLGYLSVDQEIEMLNNHCNPSIKDEIKTILSLDEIALIRTEVEKVRISNELKKYIVYIVSETRMIDEVKLGASPRATISLMRSSQALALIRGEDFVTPDIIKELAVPVIAHRITSSGGDNKEIIKNILKKIDFPL